MAKITQEQIAALKQQHGSRLYLVEDPEAGDIVFRPAAQDDWDELVDGGVNGTSPSASTRTIVDACVVFPDMAAVQQIHSELPALADQLLSLIRSKSGGRKELTAKKL